MRRKENRRQRRIAVWILKITNNGWKGVRQNKRQQLVSIPKMRIVLQLKRNKKVWEWKHCVCVFWGGGFLAGCLFTHSFTDQEFKILLVKPESSAWINSYHCRGRQKKKKKQKFNRVKASVYIILLYEFQFTEKSNRQSEPLSWTAGNKKINKYVSQPKQLISHSIE